jgi:hypothetical protein
MSFCARRGVTQVLLPAGPQTSIPPTIVRCDFVWATCSFFLFFLSLCWATCQFLTLHDFKCSTKHSYLSVLYGPSPTRALFGIVLCWATNISIPSTIVRCDFFWATWALYLFIIFFFFFFFFFFFNKITEATMH